MIVISLLFPLDHLIHIFFLQGTQNCIETSHVMHILQLKGGSHSFRVLPLKWHFSSVVKSFFLKLYETGSFCMGKCIIQPVDPMIVASLLNLLHSKVTQLINCHNVWDLCLYTMPSDQQWWLKLKKKGNSIPRIYIFLQEDELLTLPEERGSSRVELPQNG